ncbi:MAG: branched-chain amino acid ABC transporter permease [Oscillospiraceae bacterium]|jgi:branched-chain amino acid transport system permease protein|nr:branched-chain amino acid ABC transporter permease [Oscillospiraceae bacterium]
MRFNILEIVVFGLINGSIFALISMGLSMQYGVARILNVAHGEFIMLGAFLTWMMVTSGGIHPLLALLLCCPIMLAVGFVLHRTAYKRLKDISPNAGAFEGNAMLLSFGILYVVQALAQMRWGSSPQNYVYNNVPLKIDFFIKNGVPLRANLLIVFILAIIICVAFYLFLAKTKPGKSIRAAAMDPVSASLMGIKISTVMALCFGLGTLLAGTAGTLLSMHQGALYTTMGMQYTMTAIIVVVLGGLGSIPGSIVGGFILGLVGYAASKIDPSLENIVNYAIIMVLLLVRPKGLLGR